MLASIANSFASANLYFNQALSQHFHALDAHALQPMIFIFALAFGYGVIHALGPGHGKALVAGYLLANPTKRGHVFQIGFLIALIHACSALCVTAAAMYVVKTSTMRLFGDVNPPLFQISGALILMMGAWLLYDVWQSKRIQTESIRPHKSRFGVIVSAGIVPCPGVITLNFFAITLGHLAIGFIASLFMSIGMGLSISLAGLLAHTLQSSSKIKAQPKWFWSIRVIGVLCVIALGIALLFVPHPRHAF